MELSRIRVPPGWMAAWNFAREALFITIQHPGWDTMAKGISSSEMTTEQLAVPPRISAP